MKKYFPLEYEDGEIGKVPLCETDYFRRLQLLCAACNLALRGSYITACNRKYHIEHFTCSMCDHLFGPSDSYYEHENKVYCQKHYCEHFAARCRGCTAAILQQFIEIYRNGSVQRWHPDCYMIYKFLNVKLSGNIKHLDPDDAASGAQSIVEKSSRIWSVLSTYEERAASIISDMLLKASSGQPKEALAAGEKFVDQLEVLFISIEKLDKKIRSKNGKYTVYSREVRMLCKKIIAFFVAISNRNGSNEDLNKTMLPTVAGLAHYLKILMRVALTTALRLERDHWDTQSLRHLLYALESHGKNPTLPLSAKVDARGNICIVCQNIIEEDCFAVGLTPRWHYNCLRCNECAKSLRKEYRSANWIEGKKSVLCQACNQLQGGSNDGSVVRISKLKQYIFLVRIALLSATEIVSNGASYNMQEKCFFNVFENESDDANGEEDEDGGEEQIIQTPTTPAEAGAQQFPLPQGMRKENYSAQVDGERRRRTENMGRKVSDTARKARHSRIVNLPEGDYAPVQSAEEKNNTKDQNSNNKSPEHQSHQRHSSTILHVIDDSPTAPTGPNIVSPQYIDYRSITLDDIERVYVSQNFSGVKNPENVNKSSNNKTKTTTETETETGAGAEAEAANNNEEQKHSADPENLQKISLITSEGEGRLGSDQFISDLPDKDHFILRHVALAALSRLLDQSSLVDDLLPLLETRKSSLWEKFGKAFRATGQDKKTSKKKVIFGAPLEYLCENYYSESVNGAGPCTLRIPQILDDLITVLRSKGKKSVYIYIYIYFFFFFFFL